VSKQGVLGPLTISDPPAFEAFVRWFVSKQKSAGWEAVAYEGAKQDWRSCLVFFARVAYATAAGEADARVWNLPRAEAVAALKFIVWRMTGLVAVGEPRPKEAAAWTWLVPALTDALKRPGRPKRSIADSRDLLDRYSKAESALRADFNPSAVRSARKRVALFEGFMAQAGGLSESVVEEMMDAFLDIPEFGPRGA
jgi:hypothetical protein